MQKEEDFIDSRQLCDNIVEGMQDNKAQDIVLLDLREVDGAVTDFFVICSGNNPTQIEGIAHSIVRKTRADLKERPARQEGTGFTEWMLLDYINVVVHVFSTEKRAFYNLEDLWADAKREDIPNLD